MVVCSYVAIANQDVKEKLVLELAWHSQILIVIHTNGDIQWICYWVKVKRVSEKRVHWKVCQGAEEETQVVIAGWPGGS